MKVAYFILLSSISRFSVHFFILLFLPFTTPALVA